MKKNLLSAALVALLSTPFCVMSQAPVLGTAANFALFSTNGAVSSTGLSHLTGHVGTNNGSSTNFGNVDGVMHDADGTSAAAASDLTIAYGQLFAAIPNYFIAPIMGNGQTLIPGTYEIGQTASLNNILILDGQGNSNSVFIFKIQGAFSSAAGAQVQLTNGALACNVFWKIEGLVDLATNTIMKGTVIANNAAIILNSGASIEGRALSTTGAVTVSNATVRTPLGCLTPQLTGPVAPDLGTVACYTIFSGNGEVTNTGISFITGDVGTNVGLTTGFQAVNVIGTIHPIPDTSTAQCASDLSNVYAYLSTLPVDIELLYPAVFGSDLQLTPHTYLLDAATVLTNTVYLNAQGNPDAVFVLKIVGALSTGTFAKVELMNGALAQNVYWIVDGAINLNDYSEFKGTLIGNNGAIILNTGVAIEGRVLSTSGGVTTFAIDAQMTPGCSSLATPSVANAGAAIQFYPNPFSSTLNVVLPETSNANELAVYNMLGALVLKATLTQSVTSLPLNLPAGVYLYKVTAANGVTQSGKLIARD